MELKPELFGKVKEDLEAKGAIVTLIAYSNPKSRLQGGERWVDYIIGVEWPNGREWEIVNIKET